MSSSKNWPVAGVYLSALYLSPLNIVYVQVVHVLIHIRTGGGGLVIFLRFEDTEFWCVRL